MTYLKLLNIFLFVKHLDYGLQHFAIRNSVYFFYISRPIAISKHLQILTNV